MSIVTTTSVSEFFNEAVGDAIKSRRVDATDGATRYLVSLLADYARPDDRAGELLDRPLTLLLDEAMHAGVPGERFERLRTLGDGVLYSCGFFADHFEARGVDPHYLYGIGTVAYGTASSMLQKGEEPKGTDIFGELAGKFVAFVDVVADVAHSTIAMGTQSSKTLLRVYERWLKTGSDRLAHTLTAQGLVPVRTSRGVH